MNPFFVILEFFSALGLSFNFYNDSLFNAPYDASDFPLSFEVNDMMYLALQINTTNPATKLVVQQCFATSTNKYDDPTRYNIIDER